MKSFTKFVICAAALTGISLGAAEVINIADSKFMRPALGKVVIANNQITHTGKAFIFGKTKFDIDPAKKYTFKYTIVNNSDKMVIVYGGINAYDAAGKEYSSYSWQGNPKSMTEVVADAKKGDTKLTVKNGSAWVTNPSTSIVVNAKADFSDVPNKNAVADRVIKREKTGDVWVLTLEKPLRADVKAGTVIRQHFHSGYFYLRGASPSRVAPKSSVTVNTTIQGNAAVLGRFNQKNWPVNAKKASFLLLSNYTNVKADVIIKDATLTIE